MIGFTNNLYPPIVDTYQPAFVINRVGESKCKIYFALSSYNTLKDISSAQISVVHQKSNASALNKKYYPSGIKICTIKVDNMRKTDDKYYIELSSSDLEGNTFNIDQYYKIQIRFTSALIADKNIEDNKLASWLIENIDFFSEWSTVCLIRGISRPIIELQNFDNAYRFTAILHESTLNVTGKLKFENREEQETLKSYRAYLYTTDKQLVADSGEIFTNPYNNINEISYTFNYELENNHNYLLVIKYTTSNLYSATQKYYFSVTQEEIDSFVNFAIQAKTEEELGCIKVLTNITFDETIHQGYQGYLTFRRTSSESNFTKWEDIYIQDLDIAEPTKLTWYDYTVKSGVWYLYGVQTDNFQGNKSVLTKMDKKDATIASFEDMFLCAEGQQLRIRYNPQITSMKRNILESKVDTLGSKFPFITRNGAVEYNQFSISGMITLHNDIYENVIDKDIPSFTSEEQLFYNNDIVNLYKKYNEETGITLYNDYIYEREFREKVIDFLYKDNVKLLRTTTEGNFLIKIMDINLNPEPILGRMIYSFSATAYEIADCTILNLDKYNIINLKYEDFLRDFANRKTRIGQLDTFFYKDKDIFTYNLSIKYKPLARKEHEIEIERISQLKIEIKDEPYPIGYDERGHLKPLSYFSSEEKTTKPPLLGYLIYINGDPIFVHRDGIYELDGPVSIHSLYFAKDTNATIDYLIDLKEKLIIKNINTFNYETAGQIWGNFDYKESTFFKIWSKYFSNQKQYRQRIIAIDNVKIETIPNAIIYVNDNSGKEDSLKKIIANDTGLISFAGKDVRISDVVFYGIKLREATAAECLRATPIPETYIKTNIKVKSFDEISNPIDHGIYTVGEAQGYVSNAVFSAPDTALCTPEDLELFPNEYYVLLMSKIGSINNLYIYFNNNWYPFDKQEEAVLCPVDAIIDYRGEINREVVL